VPVFTAGIALPASFSTCLVADAQSLANLRRTRRIYIRTDSAFARERMNTAEGARHDRVAVDYDNRPGRLRRVCVFRSGYSTGPGRATTASVMRRILRSNQSDQFSM
jgi:hypothetical protein